MRILAIVLIASVWGISCSRPSDDFQPDTIVALERGALDRWGKGDPQGFFDIMATGQTYFVLLKPGVMHFGLGDVSHAACSSFALTPAIT